MEWVSYSTVVYCTARPPGLHRPHTNHTAVMDQISMPAFFHLLFALLGAVKIDFLSEGSKLKSVSLIIKN